MTYLAEVELSYALTFGDTDNDGAREILLTGRDGFFHIWEHRGADTYDLVAGGTTILDLGFAADHDRDGRGEAIGQYGGYIHVLESPDPSSHPSNLVWSSPYLSNLGGRPTGGDSDRDGRMEIIHSVNGFGSSSGLVIYENTGDNAYDLVFSTTIQTNGGEKVVADFDSDGLQEVAICGSPGRLYIFESPSDDVWVQRFNAWTGLFNAYGLDGGVDTDGNGWPEIFVYGNTPGSQRTVAVYEATGDNSFGLVATLSLDPGIGYTPAALVNVDGVGPVEYLVSSGPGIYVFRSHIVGKWDLVGIVYNEINGSVDAFDLNGNGLPEVIWGGFTTRILEYAGAPTDTSFESGRRLTVIPNPCAQSASLRLPFLREPATLTVLDVRGRIVERRRVEALAQVHWDARNLPNGSYHLRLTDPRGRVLASGRSTIVR